MKNTFLGSVVVAALLAVGVVGCVPLQQTSGDDGYYEPDTRVSTAPSRIYVEDPYRPGYQILMERDPFSGRYYPVTRGSVYGAPGAYGSSDPYYGRGAYRDPYYRPRYNGGRGSYRQQPAPRPQQTEQRRQDEQRRQNAADDILRKKQ
ncbi:MAG: hypothetical protein EOO15_13365 [Chitinophagaceae bacterium]|nr:MAG: hypothetical protein EOO15_13365 [Chitinophagaceae bacterium]